MKYIWVYMLVFGINCDDNDKQFIVRHSCPYNIKDIHTMYNVKGSYGTSETIQYL